VEQVAEAIEEVVVITDNAPSHTAGAVREREEQWKQQGLTAGFIEDGR
jgi:hypothetical protein